MGLDLSRLGLTLSGQKPATGGGPPPSSGIGFMAIGTTFEVG